MKKIALVLAVLLVVSGAAFAEVDVYVGGQAQTSFNYDLDAQGYALANSLYAEVDLTFGEAVDRSGEGDVYGMISISNLALTQYYVIAGNDYTTQAIAAPTADSGGHWSTDPVWTAKIVAGDFYFKVDGNEYIRTRRSNMATVLDSFSIVGINVWANAVSATMAGTAAVGGTVEGLGSFVVKFGTESATAVASNPVGAAVDFSLSAVDNLMFDVSFVYANTAAAVLGAGASVGYSVAVSDMTVTPYGAIDYDLQNSSMEIGGGLKVDWASDKDGLVRDDLGAWKGFFGGSQRMVGSGLNVAVAYNPDATIDLMATAAYLPVADVNSALIFEMQDLAGAGTMGLGAYADYKGVEDVKVFGWFQYTTVLDLVLGAEYSGIDNTTLGVKYTNKATAGDTSGDVSVYAKVAAW